MSKLATEKNVKRVTKKTSNAAYFITFQELTFKLVSWNYYGFVMRSGFLKHDLDFSVCGSRVEKNKLFENLFLQLYFEF